MYLNYSTADQLCYVGHRGFTLPYDGPFESATQRDDPIRYALLQGISLCYLRDPLSLAGGHTSLDVSNRVAEPKPIEQPYNPLTDNLRYGRGLYSFFHGVTNGAVKRVRRSREKGVTHSRILGMYEYVPHDLMRVSPSGLESSIWGVVYPKLATDPFGRVSLGHRIHVFNGHCDVSFEPTFYAEYYVSDVLSSYRARLEDSGEYSVGHQFAVDGGQHRVELKSLSYRYEATSLKCEYVIRYRKLDLFGRVLCELMRDCSLTLEAVKYNGYNPGPEWYTPPLDSMTFVYSSTYHDYVSTSGYVHPGWMPLVGVSTETIGRVQDSRIVSTGISDNDIRDYDYIDAKSAVDVCLDNYIVRIELLSDSLYAGSFYSTAEALRGWMDIISSNLIEFCAELGSLASLLPDVAGLVRIYNDVRNLRLLKAGVSIADLITGAKLWWAFGVEPDSKIALEFINKHDELAQKMPSLTGSRTLYGRFHHVEGDLDIELRSKVRISLTQSVLLQAIVGLNAVGLLPSPGQLWDAVPFSFVVDWFFNIGQKLKAVDTQGILLALPCDVGTHSFKVETKDLSLDLSPYNFQPVGDSGTAIGSYYHRGVSALLPSLRDASFDYLPPNPPPWDTALSFIYQIMKF